MFRKEYQERNNVDLRRKEDLKHGKRDFYGMRQTSKSAEFYVMIKIRRGPSA
jgi:hypothetical protein